MYICMCVSVFRQNLKTKTDYNNTEVHALIINRAYKIKIHKSVVAPAPNIIPLCTCIHTFVACLVKSESKTSEKCRAFAPHFSMHHSNWCTFYICMYVNKKRSEQQQQA
ncbi:unnamed protein product [Ceratitis capitata]|uniref:(Mediterranean fruit fly) hypothetical protein n=1 Tax=Ceratitis capitata TaxID=7213 RepID=A0A811UE39_CERCA|nr:unnamed protein product [Ceratitis capitata]